MTGSSREYSRDCVGEEKSEGTAGLLWLTRARLIGQPFRLRSTLWLEWLIDLLAFAIQIVVSG